LPNVLAQASTTQTKAPARGARAEPQAALIFPSLPSSKQHSGARASQAEQDEPEEQDEAEAQEQEQDEPEEDEEDEPEEDEAEAQEREEDEAEEQDEAEAQEREEAQEDEAQAAASPVALPARDGQLCFSAEKLRH
jgi:hypothetical protein